MSDRSIHRYTDRPFPPYTYVPGSGSPHPISDPRGHMHADASVAPAPLDPDNWQRSETYLYGIDLFNHGYYWEAHEAWESLWHAAGRNGKVADFLKGLIKLAAAGVKSREGHAAGVQRHLKRGTELLAPMADGKPFAGIEISAILKEITQLAAEPTGPFALKLALSPPPASAPLPDKNS